jgi:group I intron endonuclease
MINISTIYKITSPSGKVYIGQTVDLRRRLVRYKRADCKLQKALHSSILKYGWESHTVEILYAGPLTGEGRDQLEIHYIRIYNSFKGGLNLTEGGGAFRGVREEGITEEYRAKLSAAKKGKPKSPEHREALSRARKGRVVSDETKTKMAAAKKGKKQSKEHLARLSEVRKGRKFSEETIVKRVATRKKNREAKESKKG